MHCHASDARFSPNCNNMTFNNCMWKPECEMCCSNALWLYCLSLWLVKCVLFVCLFVFTSEILLTFFFLHLKFKSPWNQSFHISSDTGMPCVLCVLLTLVLSYCCFRSVAWLWMTWNETGVPTYITTSLFSNTCVCACVRVLGWIRFWEKARFQWIRKWGTNCTQMENLWKAWACWDVCVRWRGRWV